MVSGSPSTDATVTCRYVVVGADTVYNFRLAEILRKVRGKDLVVRFLDLAHVEPFIQRYADEPLIVFFDLFGFDLISSTNLIGLIRERHPKVVFCIYTDKAEFESRRNELPDSWRERFSHYYKLFREEDDPSAEFEPVVRASLFRAECEAAYNATHEPIRLTPVFTRGLSAPDNELSGGSDGNIAFVSYARRDWDEFVCKLVSDLAKESYRVWIDQNYLVGGDDWMDAIGQALQICDKLLLIISPDSVISKYVKMEYRYFFKQDKPIIPILYKKVDHIPFEIATLHHIDFTHADRSRSYQELIRILPRQRR